MINNSKNFCILIFLLGIIIFSSSIVINYLVPSKFTSKPIGSKLISLNQSWETGQEHFSHPEIDITFSYPAHFRINTKLKYIDQNRNLIDQDSKLNYQKSSSEDQILKKSSYNYFFTFSTEHNPFNLIENKYQDEHYDYQELCSNNLSVWLKVYPNPNNLSLIELIKEIYAGEVYFPGGPTGFDFIRPNLIATDWPIEESYAFEGIFIEWWKKIIWFYYKNNVYEFNLSGGCNTGGSYSQEGEQLFDEIISSIKYL